MDWHGGNLFQILLFQHKHIKIRKRGPFNLLMQIYIHIQYLFFLHSLHRVVQYFKLNVAGLSLIDTIQDLFVRFGHETTYVNFLPMSPKLVQTQPHTVENRGITMAPLFLRLIS